MHLKYHYYYFQSALSSKLCNKIIKYGLERKKKIALTGLVKDKSNPTSKEIKESSLLRNSDIVWMDDEWIYKEIHPYIKEANRKAGWNFDWDFTEECQFTIYKENQFYDWHSDSTFVPYDLPKDLNHHGKIRKLSVTISLSDESDYEGGEFEFEFDFRNQDKHDIEHCVPPIKPKGSIVVFPSFVWHRVKPITSGTRYSLVLWNIGKPFR
tara:strand:+ start:2559 stop:3188 length:630 start_codon:yes stop_codon:yes gene_type:complete